ncbi:MAG: hypothetical protein HOV81_18765 [Kofleriaceae bacterium]|nr:hypothetical protein [Kofleriaceae bacterium]
MSARAHVDAVTDFQRHGVQAGVNVGFGYAGKKGAVIGSLGVDSGTAPTLGIHDTIDYVHMPEREVGWRAGFGGTAALIGEPSFVGIRAAPLIPLRQRFSSHQSEKGGGDSSESLLAVSIETAVGAAVRQGAEQPDGTHAPGDVRVGASAGVGLELYWLSRMWL